MMINFRSFLNAHALNRIIKPIDMPAQNLGVANDEKHDSIPLLLFTEQHLKQPKPEVIPADRMSYENGHFKGANATLSLEDFDTDSFYVGNPFGGVD